MKKLLLVGIAFLSIQSYAAVYDLSVVKSNMPEYKVMGTSLTISGEINNLGTATINAFDLYYSVNGGTPVLKHLSNAGFSSSTNPFYFTHTVAYSIPAVVGIYNIKVWCADLDGNADQVPANDTLNYNLNVLSLSPTKKILVEEATGAWCQFCPDGAVVMDGILNAHSNAIGIAIHNADGMTTTAGDAINTTFIYGSLGYPTGWVDRHLFDGYTTVGQNRGNWASMANDRLTHGTPASVAIAQNYNPSTRVLSATVTASYYGITTGDQRVNLIISEDSVTGTGTGYNQVNAFNGSVGHPMYQKGNPIVGYNHRHVARHFVGGSWGTASVIPSTTADGGTYSKVYTYTLPSTWNENRVALIATVQKYHTDKNKRDILNTVEDELHILTSVNNNQENPVSSLAIYPNPFRSIANIDFTLSQSENVSINITNILGAVVSSTNLGNTSSGRHYFTFNGEEFPAGIYFITIKTESGELTKKVSLTK